MSITSSAPLQRSALASFLAAAVTRRVLVLGDIMLDEYVDGGVSRISPEAPVPVLLAARGYHRLGGAANVAHGVAALGGKASLSGMVGDDAAADALLKACGDAGIDANHVIRDGRGPTTRKLRFLAQHQQMLRVDWEALRAPTMQQVDSVLAAFRDGDAISAVLISDYAKGFLSADLLRAVIATARQKNIPVVVDPKSQDLARYDGATVITPNLKELGAIVGSSLGAASENEIDVVARELLADRNIPALVVTLGDRGLMVVEHGRPCHVIRAAAREVFDVTGAGDTVAAMLGLGLATGLALSDAAAIANLAAGVVVGKVGTSVVTREELAATLRPAPTMAVFTRDELVERVRAWRAKRERIVFTNGCFDLLHIGHIELLHQAAQLGDRLIVGVNSDASVKRLKGSDRPLVAEDERSKLLAALSGVDAVTIFDEDTPLALIEALRPNVIVKGGDYRREDVVGGAFVESIGGEVKIVPLLADRSTSRLVGLMK